MVHARVYSAQVRTRPRRVMPSFRLLTVACSKLAKLPRALDHCQFSDLTGTQNYNVPFGL